MVPQGQPGCQHITSICLQPLQPTGKLQALDPSSWPYKILQSISPPAYGIWESHARFQGRFNLPQCAVSKGVRPSPLSALWNLWPNLKIRGKIVLNQKNQIKFSHVVSFCKKKKKKTSSYSLTKFDHPEKFINFNTHTHTQKRSRLYKICFLPFFLSKCDLQFAWS